MTKVRPLEERKVALQEDLKYQITQVKQVLANLQKSLQELESRVGSLEQANTDFPIIKEIKGEGVQRSVSDEQGA